MKRIYTILLASILCLSNQQCNEIDYSDERFDTLIDRKLALLKYAKEAKESTGKKREKYLIKYFKAYPSDFETEFKLLFGKHYYSHDLDEIQLGRLEEAIFHGTFYGDTMYFVWENCEEKYLHKLYKEYDLYNYISNPWGTFHPKIKYVRSEEEIPKEPISPRFQEVYDNMKAYYQAYYDALDMLFEELPKVIPQEVLGRKAISLTIGGGGGFSVDRMFGFVLPWKMDETLFIKLLEERTDDEISSYFYAIYVDSHILSKKYQENYERKKKLSPRVAAQMQRAYERVLHDGACCCGH